MANRVLVLLGTKKGAFILESDARAPLLDAARPVLRDLADEPCRRRPRHRHDLCRRRQRMVRPGGLEVDRSRRRPGRIRATGLGLSRRRGADQVRCGASPPRTAASMPACEPAGLFRSDDGGQSWQHVAGLRDHPSRPDWHPGGGGLILHSLVTHPDDEQQIWVGISAAGVFHTADGGKTWEPRNRGTRADFLPEGPALSGIRPVRALPGDGARHARPALPAEPLRHVSQRRWRPAAGTASRPGLPSTFGFPAAAHPRDPDTLFLLPLNGDMRRPLCAGRQGRGLAHARRRRELAGTARGPAAGERVLRRAAPGHGDRPARAGRRLFRHQHRLALSPAPTKATAGPASPQHLPTICSVETLVVEA